MADTYVGDLDVKDIWSYDLPVGASYISMPVLPADATPDSVFGSDANVFEWDIETQDWVSTTELECKRGYYIYCPTARTVIVTKDSSCSVSIDDLISIYDSLSFDEWAFVGPNEESITVTDTVLEGCTLGYDKDADEWNVTDTLEPQAGYWIYKGADGDITKVELDNQTLPEGGTLDWRVDNEATIKVYFKNICNRPSTFRIWTTDEDGTTLCDVTTDDEIPADGTEYSVECGSFTPSTIETKTLTAHIDP